MAEFDVDDWEDVEAEEYERMVSAIIAGQLKHEPGIHNVAHDEQYSYAFGEKQIDVLVESEGAEDEITTLVECKLHKDPIDQDILASMAFYLQYSDADQAVVVSKSGFHKGAREIAKGCDIRIFQIDEVDDEEVEPQPISTELDLTIKYPKYRHVVRVCPAGQDPHGNWTRLRDVHHGTEPWDTEILDANGYPVGETVREHLNAATESASKTGKICTEFNDEQVKIDDTRYTLLEGVSQENPSRAVSSSYLIDIADQFEIKLVDPLDDERAHRSLGDVKRDILLVDTD
ncbi:restriction endonuclease [Halovivax gelatinilyticus]|uniref:restriction endonuclease n=1 Tax=Halovivax gelatinilyticus TaxID=2961597 RepID=UPI0020CA30B7|nr:restriction endonuclease [Halovivax gelatinilyticus]